MIELKKLKLSNYKKCNIFIKDKIVKQKITLKIVKRASPLYITYICIYLFLYKCRL